MQKQEYPQDIIIRPAIEADAAQLCDAEKYWAAQPGYLVSQPNELRSEAFSQTIIDLTDKKSGKYLVAEIKDQIVGHAFIENSSLASIKHIGRLTIVVHPEYVGKGIGKKLLNTLLEWARNESVLKKIELLVRAPNTAAINLYKKSGFEEEGRLRNRIQIAPDKFIDDIIMGLCIAGKSTT